MEPLLLEIQTEHKAKALRRACDHRQKCAKRMLTELGKDEAAAQASGLWPLIPDVELLELATPFWSPDDAILDDDHPLSNHFEEIAHLLEDGKRALKRTLFEFLMTMLGDASSVMKDSTLSAPPFPRPEPTEEGLYTDDQIEAFTRSIFALLECSSCNPIQSLGEVISHPCKGRRRNSLLPSHYEISDKHARAARILLKAVGLEESVATLEAVKQFENCLSCTTCEEPSLNNTCRSFMQMVCLSSFIVRFLLI